jgi:DNA-binding CsgD family transcriptional regulator
MPVEYGEPLTERELEMVALVAEGLTNREIAAQVYLSPNTVKVHLRNIFTKTGVASRTELSILAVRERWIAVPEAAEETAPVEVEVATLAGETTVEPADATTPAPLPSSILPDWSRLRWISLSAGLILALLVLFLPSGDRGRAVGGSPGGLIDEPVSEVAAPVPTAEDRWEELAPLPVRRTRFAAAALNRRLYVFGGVTPEGTTDLADVYLIDEARWESIAPRPLALANVEAVPLQGGLFVPGGCDAQGAPTSAVHFYDPDRDAWEERAALPEPLCAYALAADTERAYLFGGWDGGRFRAVAYAYDPLADTWEELAPPAEARGFGGAAVLAERAFYVGGYDGVELAACELYLPEEDRWETCAPLLQPRGGLGLVALGGQLYAIGGGWESYLGFNERYDPTDDLWTVLESPLVGEWRNLGLVGWETSLYAIGGWSGDYLNRTYTLEVLPFRVFIPVTLP